MNTLSLTNAFAALSVEQPPNSAFQITHLPEELNVLVAGFLDHQSFCRLGVTASSYRQLMARDSLWKTLHDSHWSSGKLLRFDGPPSLRPRGGIKVDATACGNWREEFIRRVHLDRSVEQRLAEAKDDSDVAESLLQDGADIHDALKRLCDGRECSATARAILSCINKLEALVDWRAMHASGDKSTKTDAWTIIAKLLQGSDQLIHRRSSDQIYDDVNEMLRSTTLKDLRVMVSMDHAPDNDTIDSAWLASRDIGVFLIDQVLQNGGGAPHMHLCIVEDFASNVHGAAPSRSDLHSSWEDARKLVYVWSFVNQDKNECWFERCGLLERLFLGSWLTDLSLPISSIRATCSMLCTTPELRAEHYALLILLQMQMANTAHNAA